MAYRELVAALATLMALPLVACGQDVESDLASCQVEAMKAYPSAWHVRDGFTQTCMKARGYDFKFGEPGGCWAQSYRCYTPRGLAGRAKQWAGEEIKKLSSGASRTSR